jgi:hypothetical protein
MTAALATHERANTQLLRDGRRRRLAHVGGLAGHDPERVLGRVLTLSGAGSGDAQDRQVRVTMLETLEKAASAGCCVAFCRC